MASRTSCQAEAGSVVQPPLTLGFASRRRWLRWALWGGAGLGSQALAEPVLRSQLANKAGGLFAATEHDAEAEAFLSLTQRWARASAFNLQAALATGELSSTRLLSVVGGRLRLLGRDQGLNDAAFDQLFPVSLWPRARQLQRERREQGPRSSWHGLPVLVQLDLDHSSDFSHRLDQAGALILPLNLSTPVSIELRNLAGIPLAVELLSARQQQQQSLSEQSDSFRLESSATPLKLSGSTSQQRHHMLAELGLAVDTTHGRQRAV